MLTKKELGIIEQYVDEEFYDKEKLIKYLNIHDVVGNEVFSYCDRQKNGKSTYSSWLDYEKGYDPLPVSTFVNRTPFYFYAIDKIELSDASMLNKMSPFFALIFSAIFIKEKVRLKQAIAIAVAFVGALFIIKPTFGNENIIASMAGFIGGMCAGGAYTCVRWLGITGENGKLIVFFFSAFSSIVTAPYLIFNYHHMELWQWAALLMAGLCAAGGQFSITAAYTHAPSREISVYDYSQVVFAAIVGFFAFGDIPDLWSFVGYFIICAMAVWMFIYNNRNELRKKA